MLTLLHVPSTISPVDAWDRAGEERQPGMSVKDVYHKIATFQQQLESLQTAAADPGPSQGVLREALQAFRGMLAELLIAEAALQHSEARSTALLQTAVDGIITIDACGIVASFNPGAERLFGYTAGEAIGQNVCLLDAFPLPGGARWLPRAVSPDG